MRLEKNQEIKIYSNEHGYYTRLSKTDINGEWITGFYFVQFKKGTDVLPKSKIRLLDAWLSFYINKDGKTIFYLYVNDFELLESNSLED